MVKRKSNKKLNKLIYSLICLLVLVVGYFTTNYDDTSSSYENNIDNNNEVLVYFIDVGQADAIYIKDGSSNMMIDAGNNEDGPLLVSYLKDKEITSFDYVVATHPH